MSRQPVREDSLYNRKLKMPERKIVIVCTNLYGHSSDAPTSLCFLYNFIKLLDLLTSIIYNNFDREFVNSSVECFATYLKGECFLSLSVSPLVKVRVLTKDLTKFVRSFIMIYL